MIVKATTVDASHIVELLNSLRCAQIRVKEKWVSSSCPLAAYTHPKGSLDATPSFGVHIEPNAPSHWRCFGCAPSRGGSLNELLWALKRYEAQPFEREFALIRVHDLQADTAAIREKLRRLMTAAKPGEAVTWSGKTKALPATAREMIPSDIPILAESDLTTYFDKITPASDAGKYLRGRGVSPPTWAEWELRWHGKARRVAIPIRNLDGKLVGITGRSIVPTEKKRWMHSKGYRRDYVLFGEHKVTAADRVGVLVEGHFDVIGLWSKGYVTVGVQGSYLSQYQIKRACELFDTIVILRDGDEAGKKAAELWRDALVPYRPTRIADVLDGRDPDEYSQDELADRVGPPTVRQHSDPVVF